MRLDLNNNATTDIEPDVVMPRTLAEWFVAMLDTFPHTRPAQETDPE